MKFRAGLASGKGKQGAWARGYKTQKEFQRGQDNIKGTLDYIVTGQYLVPNDTTMTEVSQYLDGLVDDMEFFDLDCRKGRFIIFKANITMQHSNFTSNANNALRKAKKYNEEF